MKIGCIGWWESSSVIATTRTSPLDSRLRGNDEWRGRNDENAEWRGSTARSKAAWAHFRTNDDMRFADYRNGLGWLTVSTNCLSA